MTDSPALCLLEIADIPAGFRALDALCKEAPVEVVAAGTVQPGLYLVLFVGQVEPVEFAYARGAEIAGSSLQDSVLLPQAEPRILPALRDGKPRWPAPGDTLGVLQSGSSATLLRTLDAALKGAAVELVEARIADGLGGRGLATVWGEISDVEAAIAHAESEYERGQAVGFSTAVIPNAEPDVGHALGSGTRLWKEQRG